MNRLLDINPEIIAHLQKADDYERIAEFIRDADPFGRMEDIYREKLITADYHRQCAYGLRYLESKSSRLLTAA